MFPKRGALAALLTTILLVLLLTFKTPDPLPLNDSAAFPPQSEIPSLVAYVEPPASEAAGSDAAGSASEATASGATPTQTAGTTTLHTPALGSASTSKPVPGASRATVTVPTSQPANQSSAGSNSTPAATAAPTAAATTAATTAPTAAPTKGVTGSFDGTTVQMKYGPVQVRVVYSNGKITDVVPLQTPTADSRSVQIAQRAVPILRSEALSAQSAKINTVSGATYTSDGYKTSLQSAIDKA